MDFYRVFVYEDQLDEMIERIESEFEGDIKSVLHNGNKYYIVYFGKEMN